MIAVAGAILFVIPDPERDPVAEAYALQAESDEAADPGSPADREVPDKDAANAIVEEPAVAADPSEEAASWLAAMSSSEAAAELSILDIARRTTTTEATTTTAAPTTAPTTAKPTTTTAAETSESMDESDESAKSDESTDAATSADGEATAEGSADQDSADGTGDDSGTSDSQSGDPESGDPDSEGETTTTVADESTTTTEESTTTTEATTTTAPDNGFVDAGHGVFVPPVLLAIRRCESTDNYTAANPSSSARGAYQFLTGSWSGYGHAARYGVSQAHLATPAQQDEAALITWQRDGTRPWLASKHCWG